MIIIYVIKTLYKWGFIIIYVCLSLRLKGLLQWDYIYVFWALWLLLIINGLLCFCQFFIVVILKYKKNICLTHPTLTLFFNTGLTISFSCFLSGITDFINFNDKVSLSKSCTIFGFILLFYSAYVLVFIKPLSY